MVGSSAGRTIISSASNAMMALFGGRKGLKSTPLIFTVILISMIQMSRRNDGLGPLDLDAERRKST